jgi:hypothetical protein
MLEVMLKRFEQPDETRVFEKGKRDQKSEIRSQ